MTEVRVLGPAWADGLPHPKLKVGATVRSRRSTTGALWRVEGIENRYDPDSFAGRAYGPLLYVRSLKSGSSNVRGVNDFVVVEEVALELTPDEAAIVAEFGIHNDGTGG